MHNQNIDKFFKIVVILFGQLFIDAFGLNYHITRIYGNEVNLVSGDKFIMDLVFETVEGVLLNIEFQDCKITESHYKRYADYKFNLEIQSQQRVITIIICSYHIETLLKVFEETDTTLFRPIVKYLKDLYNEEKFINIEDKIINNIVLNKSEIQFLVLLPFMEKKKSRPRIIMDVCDLVKKIKDNKLFNDNTLFLPLVLAIDHYIEDSNEKNKLIEMIKMDIPIDETCEKILKSGYYEEAKKECLKKGEELGKRIGKSEGKRIGKREGERIGRRDTLKACIKSLLGKGMSIEGASELLDLDLDEVNTLMK